ncbi:C-type lectin domain family 2 member D11 isoform X3 [Bubalus bubalis]|uniref:C-type lectin domain family 2 member D11 isoform X3 n=1 Tax=Bubalus bubalis TaxID=89462 RepID=UPI001E1B9CE5|nr:C-type lectin domain family 2 member D11 isoform X3 [Bubalus bubalis]
MTSYVGFLIGGSQQGSHRSCLGLLESAVSGVKGGLSSQKPAGNLVSQESLGSLELAGTWERGALVGKDLPKKCLAITSSVTPAKLCCCILIIFILVALNVATLSALLADSENWTLSQISCTSVGAVLAQFETEDELNFLTRYKDIFDYWIGLSRESSHHAWKWTDNSKLNAPFVIQGTGECAYLTDSGVSSGKRYVIRKRICSKTNTSRGHLHSSALASCFIFNAISRASSNLSMTDTSIFP